MAEKIYQLYQIELPDGKKYYGITKMTLAQRSGGKGGSRYHENKELYKLIEKQGLSNFNYKTLKEFDNKEDALLWEGHYILKEKTYLPECGFNTHKNISTFHRHYSIKFVRHKECGEWVSTESITAIQNYEKCSYYMAKKMIAEKVWNEEVCDVEGYAITDKEEMELVKPYFDYITKKI